MSILPQKTLLNTLTEQILNEHTATEDPLECSELPDFMQEKKLPNSASCSILPPIIMMGNSFPQDEIATLPPKSFCS